MNSQELAELRKRNTLLRFALAFRDIEEAERWEIEKLKRENAELTKLLGK